jgi:tetratricopeptide (TPR) repeat protein
VFGLVGLIVTLVGAEKPGFNRQELSLRAGPTEPGEALNLVWLEAMVYPKELKNDRTISLGVKLTAPVESVTAAFDFSNDRIELTSIDGLDWRGVYLVPDGASPGTHVVRYVIKSSEGSIQRTVDFSVTEAALATNPVPIEGGEIAPLERWPLTVTSTCAALVGTSSRLLPSGQKVTGISKSAWFKVILENGDEGWIPASAVKEPLNDYFAQGYEAYLNEDDKLAISCFKNVLAVDPENAKARFWLAKVYLRQGNLDAAAKMVSESAKLDDRSLETKVLANVIAQQYYTVAHAKFQARRYNEAIAAYKQVLEQKPTSLISWIELGESYKQLGLYAEARSSWKEGIKYFPENRELYAQLQIEYPELGLVEPPSQPQTAVAAVPALVADDSLALVKAGQTKKGTPIERAIKSVVAMTKSLGTPIVEKGWEIKKQGEGYAVRYVCEQGSGALEAFEWLVNVDTKRVAASNENAQLLMDRW